MQIRKLQMSPDAYEVFQEDERDMSVKLGAMLYVGPWRIGEHIAGDEPPFGRVVYVQVYEEWERPEPQPAEDLGAEPLADTAVPQAHAEEHPA